ncbi:hypothetical protein [Nocardia sp. CA-290969]|uniref:hypothetical protein n=1 Tax=Nocardia sp. CA-290969 TaxID=3239986 RepID=UPI003D908EBA
MTGTLLVIRGNSASGKSTTAVTVQRRFAHGTCAVVSQDVVRRNIVREPDEPAAFNIDLIEQIAGLCLARGMVVIVEGILDANRYGAMLERLAGTVDSALFYSFDLSFAETLTRHAGRPQSATILPEQMADWYHGWQPLRFVDEIRIDAAWTLDSLSDRIYHDIQRWPVPSLRRREDETAGKIGDQVEENGGGGLPTNQCVSHGPGSPGTVPGGSSDR